MPSERTLAATATWVLPGTSQADTVRAVASGDWYRGASWDAATQAEFETRLARARPSSRAQYLRIKGVELAGAQDASAREAGRAVLQRMLSEYSDDALQTTMGWADLGHSFLEDQHFADAAACFRRSMAGLSNVDSGADVGLADAVIAGGFEDAYPEAVEVLGRSTASSSPWPATRFRWGLAAARLAERLGDHESAQRCALIALTALRETQSPFPRHRNLGLTTPDATIRRELERIADK